MYGEEDINNSKSKLNGIKVNTTINKTVYRLPSFSQNLIKIHSIYNKQKLDMLINDLYNIIYKFFHDGILIKLSLNLLSKIVCKGDLLLVSSFLENLQQETINAKTEIDKQKIEAIYDNQYLFQFLIETCFEANLIKKSNLDNTIFVPGFNLDCSKLDNKGNIIKLDDKEKMDLINNIIKISTKL